MEEGCGVAAAIHQTCFVTDSFGRQCRLVCQQTQSYVVLSWTTMWLVLCECSKFRIESNSYFSIRFNSKRVQLFEIFKYLPSPNFLLKEARFFFNRMTPIFHLSKHAQQPTKSMLYWPIMTNQVLKLLQQKPEPYGAIKNSWIYLTSTYYWWLLRPTVTIRSIRNFKK